MSIFEQIISKLKDLLQGYDSMTNNIQLLDSASKSTALFLTIIFGLITSVLTIVGLLSIFISISGQHSAQKCRELLWELKTETDRKEIIKKLSLYNNISKGNEKFTSKVITISRFTIFVVMFSTLLITTMLLNLLSFKQIVVAVLINVCIITIFARFYYLLGSLKTVTKISNLPSTKDLLNILNSQNDYSIIPLLLATNTIKVKLDNYEDALQNKHVALWIGLPFYFHGLALAMEKRFLIKPVSNRRVNGQYYIDIADETILDSETGSNYKWFIFSFSIKDMDKILNSYIRLEVSNWVKKAIPRQRKIKYASGVTFIKDVTDFNQYVKLQLSIPEHYQRNEKEATYSRMRELLSQGKEIELDTEIMLKSVRADEDFLEKKVSRWYSIVTYIPHVVKTARYHVNEIYKRGKG